MRVLTVAPPGHPRGREGIQLRDTYTVKWMSPDSPRGIWAGAAFSNPRTPEKAQRRLGGLQIFFSAQGATLNVSPQ